MKMKYNSWAKGSNHPKFWKIFANIVLENKTNQIMKSVKIDIPLGYEIDKEKSTFENIVFKKVDEAIIKWNDEYGGVEIKVEGEYFVVDAESPSFYCNWNDAMRYYNYNTKASFDWKLPTVKQLKVLSKYINEINKIIRDNKGFEIKGELWSCKEKNEFCAWNISMYDGFTSYGNKDGNYCVRAIIPL